MRLLHNSAFLDNVFEGKEADSVRPERSKRKPHNHYAGYQFERKCERLGGHLVCVIASEMNIDHQDKYAILLECENSEDSRIGPSFPSVPKARQFVKNELEKNSLWDWQLMTTEELPGE